VKRGAWTLFCGIWTYNGKVMDFQSFMNSKITFTFILTVATAQDTLVCVNDHFNNEICCL